MASLAALRFRAALGADGTQLALLPLRAGRDPL
jgi:hypothetical protein